MGLAANKLIPLHWFGHSHSTLMDVYILNLRFARKKGLCATGCPVQSQNKKNE
jgi:hypothetical protein